MVSKDRVQLSSQHDNTRLFAEGLLVTSGRVENCR